MKTHILDQDAPGLAKRLRAIGPELQQRIVTRASLVTAKKLVSLHKTTSEVLDELQLKGKLSPERAKSVMNLSEKADDEYFDLKEQGVPEEEWNRLFSEARLLRGIAVGFGASPQEDIADAVYELIKALDNPAATLQLIESELADVA
jgi:polyhydroxyalkanoate synthesis regulator phasin